MQGFGEGGGEVQKDGRVIRGADDDDVGRVWGYAREGTNGAGCAEGEARRRARD